MATRQKFLHSLHTLLYLVGCPIAIFAQNLSISGTVWDQTGRSVPEATLSLYNSTSLLSRTQSGADGSFAFPNLLAGTYVLECYKEAFQKQSRRLVLGNQSETLKFTLEIAGINQHVLVIASELPELPSEISKAVSLISPEELADREVVSLTDALRQVPSLQIQQFGGPGTLVSYRFRGLRPEDTAILLDGFRFSDPSDIKGSVGAFLSDLVATDAERIEVLRGAGSALYGTNSIGGAINVVSQQPTRPLGGSFSFQGGSLGLLQGSAGLGGQSAGQHLSYSFHMDHIHYTRGTDDHDAYRNNSGTARADYKLGPQARLSLLFRMTDSFLFLNQSPSPLPNLPSLPAGQSVRDAIAFPKAEATFYSQFDDPDNHQRNRFWSGAARLDHPVNRFWTYSLGYQGLRTQRRFDTGPGASPLAQALGFQEPPTTTRDRYAGAVDELFWRNSFAPHTANSTHVSLDWERTALDQTTFGLTTEAAQRSLTVSLMNQTRLLDQRLHFQVAFRAQRYGLDPPRFSDDTRNPFGSANDLAIPSTYNGDVSLAYFWAAVNTKVRLHAGNGYRSPSLFERFGSGDVGIFRSYFGNPLLHPERSTFLDGGFDHFAFANKLQVSGTYFYTHLQTIIEFGSLARDPFERSFGYLNLKGGSARGFELSVSSRPTSFLDFSGSYTFTKSQQPSPTSAGTTRVLGLSDHQFGLGINVRPTRRLNLNLQAYGVSDHDFPVFGLLFTIPPATYRFNGYARLDVAGSYILYEGERLRLRFAAKVDNLLDQEYYQGGFLAPQLTVRTGIRLDF